MFVSSWIISNFRRQDAAFSRHVNWIQLLLGPRAFVHVPEVDVAVTQRIPPRIEHFLVEAQNAFARNVLWRRSQRRETIVDARTVSITHARQQMPQRQRDRKSTRLNSSHG